MSWELLNALAQRIYKLTDHRCTIEHWKVVKCLYGCYQINKLESFLSTFCLFRTLFQSRILDPDDHARGRGRHQMMGWEEIENYLVNNVPNTKLSYKKRNWFSSNPKARHSNLAIESWRAGATKITKPLICPSYQPILGEMETRNCHSIRIHRH